MKKNPQPTKRGRGQPTKFTPAISRQAVFLTEKGCTDAELAEFFGVSESTLNNWKKKHPEFTAALKAGKAVADDMVQNALFKRATGFSHPDSHVSNFQGAITVTPIVKHYAPDTTACIFWLKNRKADEWREKVDVNANHTGEIRVVVGGSI